ncbi:Histidinol-phosphatase [Bosea sp. 62]|uniref:inositol monophosphatase family protein n=1 Tax=unclassified Bosea (in: a-proteobacteria) TaxID=2653178 RepID=UPI00125A644E|nr:MULTISPECIES: inositol monophosphatase family protein [unclassified Bosea (in: a-proteobacteria)]CAD5296865.1 Histidinol-phosphatase [Bosea sp. 7B]CAD5296956.1 Histidinol-phosphatase [Bosea sp. 21B]CAD5297239.1 Histidinol-phosphatase [Bosea sp. 46]VVT61212.1 Histidinol-phosphatase [Bosea sp. EC-HK365B]VXB19815.1 Histidinol-phosphatase [Bosea sp. 125]
MRAEGDQAEWLAFALRLATESGAILRETASVRPDVEVKSDRSFVTALDARIERRMREMLADRFPSHGIIGEEEAPTDLDADLVWVLDPIDGTAAFIAGLPVYGTLIALMREGEPILGIIDHPITGDRWIGVKGSPTTHNGRPCRTRNCGALGNAILSASNPDFFEAEELAALDAMRAATAWRIWGGACMSFGLLASGRTDAAFDTRLKLWDFAPFRPIIEGAGGVVTDWEGQPIDHKTGKRIMAAGDPARHREMLRLVESAMGR